MQVIVDEALSLLGVLMRASVIWGFFARNSKSLSSLPPPWGSRPSLYRHIQAHVQPGHPGLTESGQALPDEGEVFKDGGLRWVAGGIDGAFGHHGGGGQKAKIAKDTSERIVAALRRTTETNVGALYSALKENDAIDYIDLMLELIVKDPRVKSVQLHDLAKWIATEGADREPVKAAIALLGVLRGYDERELLLGLGRHEEFTLYAAVAIRNTIEKPDATLWELAKNVQGWGRIQAVERLSDTQEIEIKAWLLREGYKNSIMNEYLAYTCANAGDLHRALDAERVDDALLHGAGEILGALISGDGGPAEGMSEYEYGARATELYLRHIRVKATSLDHFLILYSIKDYLEDDERDWKELQAKGWTEDRRRAMLTCVDGLIERPDWRSKAEQELNSEDTRRFSVAAQAAARLKLDTWDEYFRRLKNGESYWYNVMQTTERSRVVKVIALAEERFPLPTIATGPAEELGLGAKFRHHSNLDFVLQDLGRFPGLGWALIKAGMKSPVIRNRHMAIRAFAAWEQNQWPEGAREYVLSCRDAEPNKDVREGFTKLLIRSQP